jgi:predicted signal transduction protein with EAL and GGDEF domain
MENRKILSAIFGITQGVIGALSAALAVMFFINILEVQAVFNVPQELLPFWLLVLGLFSVFSVVSGFFLIREWWRKA